MNFKLLTSFLVCLATFVLCQNSAEQLKKKEWWRDAAIYQIYPLSFRDKDNNGKGDLKGIIEKIPYLKETGFEGVWLSPIYSSPMVDFGYDISNYTDIHEWYGTMEDFDAMISTMHKLGMKLIMDFVPNHSSDRHEWFLKSVKRDPGYEDYYVWKDPKGFDANGNPIPPNNWLSVFYGPAWTYRKERNQFYLHQFASGQPDLNYRNPKVVEEMKNILLFWSNKGVDGFRVDAVPFLFEDPTFRNEPVALPERKDPLRYDYLQHIYTYNRPETFDMVQQWREVIDEENAADGGERFFVVEAYGGIEDTMKYFGTKERPGGHLTFNFNLLGVNNKTTAQEMKWNIDKWLDNVPEFGHSNWVIGNHDQHRIGSKIGEDMIDGMNAINLLLPGMSFTYYGEEIGMVNNDDITYEEGVDPQGCNHPKDEFKLWSRDFERTPFQWDGTTNAGFNNGTKPWLPVNKNYKILNLQVQKGKPHSHYTIFKDLMKARKWKTVREGKLLLQLIGQNSLGLVRGVSSDDFIAAIVNFSYEEDVIDLNAEFFVDKKELFVLTADAESGFEKGKKISSKGINLRGRSSLVLSTKACCSALD